MKIFFRLLTLVFAVGALMSAMSEARAELQLDSPDTSSSTPTPRPKKAKKTQAPPAETYAAVEAPNDARPIQSDTATDSDTPETQALENKIATLEHAPKNDQKPPKRPTPKLAQFQQPSIATASETAKNYDLVEVDKIDQIRNRMKLAEAILIESGRAYDYRRMTTPQLESELALIHDAKEKPAQGEIIAVGQGRIGDDGKIRALDVKKGDKVLFGKYAGTEIKIEGDEYLMMREEDILGVISTN